MAPQERVGLFVVRVWIERFGDHHFKGRITHSRDLSRPEQTTLLAADPAGVKAALTSWLDDVTSDAPD
jgi:hypothetical protein